MIKLFSKKYETAAQFLNSNITNSSAVPTDQKESRSHIVSRILKTSTSSSKAILCFLLMFIVALSPSAYVQNKQSNFSHSNEQQ